MFDAEVLSALQGLVRGKKLDQDLAGASSRPVVSRGTEVTG